MALNLLLLRGNHQFCRIKDCCMIVIVTNKARRTLNLTCGLLIYNCFFMLCFCHLSREGSPITEVEPYIPFNINPAGMQPVLTTTYLLAFPSILAR